MARRKQRRQRNASSRMRIAVCAGAVALLVAGATRHSAAQKAPAAARPKTVMKSTMTGVFTMNQADRGSDTYMNLCISCHPVAVRSAVFTTMWGGRSVADLFNVIKNTMPKSDAGSLSDAEVAQIIAFILKFNGVPPGKTQLPSDERKLKTLRIETPSMRPAKSTQR
jgi:cytochrome c5